MNGQSRRRRSSGAGLLPVSFAMPSRLAAARAVPRSCRCGAVLAAWALSAGLPTVSAQADANAEVCAHEDFPNVQGSIELQDGVTQYAPIKKNQTHRYFYSNYNVTTMNQPDDRRKLIINLEPCRGVVYIFVRKTRRCWPNPYSCIDITPGKVEKKPAECQWTHFMSEIDGSRDGTPTFFEIPLTTTKYFISVYAAANSEYTLTVLADIGAFPRPGLSGQIAARQIKELQVQLSWDTMSFAPTGITNAKRYSVYSSMLLDDDNRSNTAVFMRPDKIMNTVCGLQNNTDRAYDHVPAASCSNGRCNVTIDGVIKEKRYIFNVVAESDRGFKIAYAGLIMKTNWEVVYQAASDKTLKVVGAVSGSVLGMVVVIWFLMLKLYG